MKTIYCCPKCGNQMERRPDLAKKFEAKWKAIPKIVAEEYRSGIPTAELCVRYQTNYTYLRKRLTHLGVPIRRAGSKPVGGSISDREASIVRWYGDGESYSAIGKRFGLSRERIRQAIIKLGLPRRRQISTPAKLDRYRNVVKERAEAAMAKKAKVDAAVELWNLGESAAVCAEVLGLTVYGFRRWLSDQRLKTPGRLKYRRPNHWAIKRNGATA